MPNGFLSSLVKTPYGFFKLAVSNRGLVRIDFPSPSIGIRLRSQRDDGGNENAFLHQAKALLKNYFLGRSIKPNQVPIDWSVFSPFGRRVLKELLKIRPGQTVTYSELARKAHVPKAARAVGNVLNRNPIPVLIPCHRVVRKDSTLGGYSSGSRWKKLLLKIDQQGNSHS